MRQEELRQPLTEIFRQEFRDPAIVLHDDTTANDIQGWDSLKQVALIVAVETKFKVKFSSGEILSIKKHKDLETLLWGKLNT